MYQQVVTSETFVDYTTDCKAYLRLLNNTVEDAIITRQLKVAIKQAEMKCNRSFTEKGITIKTTLQTFAMLGVYDSTKAVTAKIDAVVTTGYAITGDVQPEIEFEGTGTIYELSYTTKADMPEMVKEWVFQTVNKFFNRNSPDATEPDDKLLEPYINLVWLP